MMELELGLKITKTTDDSASVSEYRLAKNRTGPVFQSRETNTSFILIANLKGYKRNNIYIKISEDGSKITISGEKPIQDMLMVGWVMFKKDVEITSFSKVFQIPDGVILDRIKAKYDEEECMLSIVMPKYVNGICGARIEEVKEEESGRERALERSEDDHILNSFGETSGKGSEEVSSENMLDDANVDRIKETIKAETEESNLGIKNGGGTSVRERVGKEAMETSDLECGEGFVEKNEGVVSDNGASVRGKGSNEAYEAMKTSEIEKKVSVGIPQNIGDKSHDREFEVQEMEEYGTYTSNEEEKEKKVSDKMLDGAKGNMMIAAMIDKEMEESKLGNEGGYGGSVREDDRKAENVVEKVDRQEGGKKLAKADRSFNEESQREKAGKQGFEAIITLREEFPKQLPKAPEKVGEEKNVSKMKESKKVKEEEEEESEELKGLHAEVRMLIEKDITEETRQEEIEKPKSGIKGSDQQEGFEVGEKLPYESKGFNDEKIEDPNEVIRDAMAVAESLMQKVEEGKAAQEEIPMKIADSPAGTKMEQVLVKEKVGKTEEDIKDDAETEEKVKEERYKNIQVEKNGGKMKDITRETTWKKTTEPEIQTKEKDQQSLQEEMNKRRPEVSNAVQDGKLKEKVPEKAKEIQEQLIKQQSEEQMEETEDVKNKGAEIEQFVKKEKGEKYERIQVEERGGLRKDVTWETTQKETEEPKNQNEENNQQSLQDAMSEGRLEASTTERPKDEKTEETGKVKQEFVTRKTKEREFVESTTRERIQETDGERITKSLQEVPKEEHPKALDIRTHAKEVRMGSKEIEQVSAKKTLESRKESVDQDIVKSNKAKEAEKGEQCTYNTESSKGVAAIEDDVAKQRFPSTQQFEVEEGKLQEGYKERYEPSPESQKEHHAEDLQDSTEMRDQESQHMEVLKPEEYASNATLEREKYMTQNVNDEKLRINKEIKKTDYERKQEKEHHRKSKAVEEEEAEPPGAISSLPCLTSIGVKNAKPEPHHKDLSPQTLTAETKSKEAENTEDIKAPKSITYKGAKPSEDEENRKSESVVGESPKKNTDTEFQKSVEQLAPIENEFKGHLIENQGSGEKQEVYGQEEAPGEGDYQERKKEKMPEMEEMVPEVEKTNRYKQDAERMQEPETTMVTTPNTEIQRREPCELSWSSMATHRYHQLEEKDKREASDEEVGKQESKRDEKERQGKQEVVGGKARQLKEEEECEVIIVEKEEEEEEESGGKKGKTKRTKKLFVPLIVAGSTLLVSLVFIHVHRHRARKRSY